MPRRSKQLAVAFCMPRAIFRAGGETQACGVRAEKSHDTCCLALLPCEACDKVLSCVVPQFPQL